jgi:hypothetical protein
MSSKALWNPVRNLNMSGFSGTFGLEKVFDNFQFTDLHNASPLIVWSS